MFYALDHHIILYPRCICLQLRCCSLSYKTCHIFTIFPLHINCTFLMYYLSPVRCAVWLTPRMQLCKPRVLPLPAPMTCQGQKHAIISTHTGLQVLQWQKIQTVDGETWAQVVPQLEPNSPLDQHVPWNLKVLNTFYYLALFLFFFASCYKIKNVIWFFSLKLKKTSYQ